MRYLLVGPFGNGNAATMTLPIATKAQAKRMVRHDQDYWQRYSDTVGNTYYLHAATDRVEGTDWVDGYPLASYTVTTKGIRVNNNV